MISMHLQFHSPSLNMHTRVNVLLPEFFELQGRLPVVYLLHGLTGDCDDWLYMAKAKQLASRYNIILVFPSAHNSFYTDMRYGQKFYTYIAQELQGYIESLLPIDTAQRYLCGLSMGGYGALKIALRSPSRYRAVGAFSGVLDIAEERNFKRFPAEFAACFGSRVPPEEDLFHLAKQPGAEDLPIYLACGTEDELFPQNERFAAENSHLNLRYVKEPGGHEWPFWERHLAAFLAQHFVEKTAQ